MVGVAVREDDEVDTLDAEMLKTPAERLGAGVDEDGRPVRRLKQRGGALADREEAHGRRRRRRRRHRGEQQRGAGERRADERDAGPSRAFAEVGAHA